jgi:hypothetical protein
LLDEDWCGERLEEGGHYSGVFGVFGAVKDLANKREDVKYHHQIHDKDKYDTTLLLQTLDHVLKGYQKSSHSQHIPNTTQQNKTLEHEHISVSDRISSHFKESLRNLSFVEFTWLVRETDPH